MADKDNKPVIIVKKGGHGGHHGGAWKIAYADFTTAMMCFFLCMWLINTASITTRQAIASYFRKPSVFTEGSGMPVLLGGQGVLEDAFTPPRPEDKRKLKKPSDDPARKLYGETDEDRDKHYEREGRLPPKKNRGPDKITGLNSDKKHPEESRKDIRLRLLAEATQRDLEKAMRSNPQLARLLGRIETTVESDGLRIDIMDTDKFSMFDRGSARINRAAEPAFQSVTNVLKKYPNVIEISGHTDALPFPTAVGGYTNWELSADRANAARRLIESQGLPARQIVSVSGKASNEPKLPADPNAAANRRISLKLRFDWQNDIKPNDENTDQAGLRELLRASNDIPTTPAPEGDAAKAETPVPLDTPVPTPYNSKDHVKLPDGPPINENPGFMPEEKIFGNHPILGPKELFSGR
jgi:chemotaxis protein MotB